MGEGPVIEIPHTTEMILENKFQVDNMGKISIIFISCIIVAN